MIFSNLIITDAIIYSVVLLTILLTAAITIGRLQKSYFEKHPDDSDKKIYKRKIAWRSVYILVLCCFGISISNAFMTSYAFCVGVSHGMAPDPETQKYDIPYKDVVYFNENSIKETDIDPADLKNRIIIYVRYDCPDCVILHRDLEALNTGRIVFLSSRSKTGLAVRELYDIHLAEVPQGVYINSEGKSTLVSIISGEGENLTLEQEQIATLFNMQANDLDKETESKSGNA